MRIQHNIMAMSSYRNYTNNVSAMKGNLEKLSSGYKINRAGDDAAGLAISEKMRAQITGLKQAQANAKSGINLVQTAEGALQEVQDMLNRMVKLAEQSANGTYDDNVDRKQLDKEFKRLKEEINRIDQSANFNGKALFGGPGGATNAGGITTADITGPTTPGATLTDGSTTAEAKVEFDVAGTSFKADGNVTVTVGGKDYTVAVTKDMDDKAFATALVAAINDDPITSTATGDFTAAVANNTEITLTAAKKAAVADNDLKTALGTDIAIAPATKTDKAADAAKSYTSKVTGDDGTNALNDGDKIVIGGKTFNLVADATAKGTDATKIAVDTDNTFAKQIAAAVEEYNKDTNEDFTVAYKDGVMTFTVKDGKTPTAAPTFSISDQASKISAGTVEEVKDTTGGGSGSGQTFNFQVGDTNDSWNRIQIDIKSISTSAINDISENTGKKLEDLSILNEDDAGVALKALKGMVNYISDIRGDLGAVQNRLDHTINNLSVMEENIQDAESTIRDTDIAEEMMAYTKNNILIQSAQAMLAQANQVPQGVLQLLQ